MSRYVLDTWYPLTWSRNVGRELSAHRVVERDVVLFRSQDGRVVAMEDACPHRLLPLSMGRLKGDSVECGYHGVMFDCTGKCTRIPGQDMIPGNAVVQTFPTYENMGLVWIWMGDPALADVSKVFDLPQYHDSAWSAVEGDAQVYRTNYLNLCDNLCDPAHVSFVHQTTLGNSSGDNIPIQHEQQNGKIVTWRYINDAPPIPLFAKYGNFSGNVDRWQYYHYYAPSITVVDAGCAPTGTGAEQGNRENCMQLYGCHFMTPVDEETTIDHWLHVRNFAANPELDSTLSADFRVAFDEDRIILEGISANEKRFTHLKTIKLAIDAGPRRMRRVVDTMIEKERAL